MYVYYGKSNGGWWFKASIDGHEVGGKRNLTLEQLGHEKGNYDMFKWIRDIDTII